MYTKASGNFPTNGCAGKWKKEGYPARITHPYGLFILVAGLLDPDFDYTAFV